MKSFLSLWLKMSFQLFSPLGNDGKKKSHLAAALSSKIYTILAILLDARGSQSRNSVTFN